MWKSVIFLIITTFSILFYFFYPFLYSEFARFNLDDIYYYSYVTDDKEVEYLNKFPVSYKDDKKIYIMQNDICFIFNQSSGTIQMTSLDSMPSKSIIIKGLNYKIEYISFNKLTNNERSLVKLLLSIPIKSIHNANYSNKIIINDY